MVKIYKILFFLQYMTLAAIFILFISCNFTFSPMQALSAETSIPVNIEDTRQVIEGFGGSNAWMGLPGNANLRNEVVQLLFSKTKGIGLSIIRNRIPFRELNKDGNDDKFVNKDVNGNYLYSENNGIKTYSLNWTNWDLQNTKTLITMINNLPPEEKPETLLIMSTPWTPPNNVVTQWKLNVPNIQDYPEIGGYLNPARYQDYADLLADYATQFSTQMGHPLSVLSIQNEPTWEPNYESCKWDGNQIREYLKVLGNRFALKNVSSSIKIMAPEDENFKEDLLVPTFADQDARNALSIVGVHQYDYKFKYNLAAQKLTNTKLYNKKLWMTEVSDGGPNDSSINDGLLWAQMIHYDMVIAEVNAFLYWWLWTNVASTNQSGSSLLHVVNNASILKNKRLFTIGQYSRFVRPGYYRLNGISEPLPGILISIYRSPDSKKLVIVGINSNSADKNVQFELQGINVESEVQLWRTSQEEDVTEIARLGNCIVNNGSIVVRFAPFSVTTVTIEL